MNIYVLLLNTSYGVPSLKILHRCIFIQNLLIAKTLVDLMDADPLAVPTERWGTPASGSWGSVRIRHGGSMEGNGKPCERWTS
jgi:hypothetical protein